MDNDVKTEPFEKEPIPITNLKRKSDSESSNNNKKVLKKDNNLLVEALNEKPNNFINEENKEHHEGGSEYKEEFISKGSTRSGNFELPLAVVEKVPSDLIVFGLPYELDDWAFREYFEQFGAVEYEEIKRKPNGGSRGFAFVRMINYVDQVRALSVPTHTIGGRECVLKMSALDKGKSDSYENISVNPRLYIGALSGDVGKERLREYLQEHLYRFDKRATIHEIFYPNPFRNFAFVTVTSAVAARELLRQHDFFIDGHYFMLTLAMPRKGEETTPGIIAPPIQNQRGNGWFPKQAPQQIVGPPPRGPPPPVIDNWPRPPDVYWNNYPPSVQHLQLPPQQIKKPPVFGAYGVRSNEDYMPPIRGGCVPADYVLPPRGERGYVYNNQIQRPHPSTCDQSAFPAVAGGGAGFTRKPRSPSFDPREEMLRSMPFGNQQKLGRSDNYDSWVGGESNSNGGPPLMNPTDAEVVLNKLPNDAVSTALRMLQSIMTAQQQKERLYDGRNEEEGNQR
uniref:RRM domain-containing protein n=1 Tax=Meloidogyne incognita TaxID=6306 RepID=A0A914MCA8_MELIC